jgi:hypothetical protein
MSDRQKALRLERHRNLMKRRTQQGAFEASFVPLDALTPQERETALSDGGKGAEAIYAALEPQGWREYCLYKAREGLKELHPELVTVFDLVVKNGTDREESICELAEIISAGRTPLGCATGGTLKKS